MSDVFPGSKDPRVTWISGVWDKMPVTDDISDGTGWGIKHLSDPTDTIRDGGDGEGGPPWPTIIKPIASGSMTIGGGTGGSGVKTGFDGSTSFGIKHLSDPWLRDGGGWVIKAEKQVVSDGGSDYINDPTDLGPLITDPDDTGPFGPSIISDGSAWFGSTEYSGIKWRRFGPVDPNIEGDINIPKHEVPKNGDDQYDAVTKPWFGPWVGPVGPGPGYINGNDHYDAAGVVKTGSRIPVLWKGGDHDVRCATEHGGKRYTGRTSEDINDPWVIKDPTDTINDGPDTIAEGDLALHEVFIDGGEGLDHEWYVDSDFYIMDPTWVSGHTSTFNSGHTNSFSGDWGI